MRVSAPPRSEIPDLADLGGDLLETTVRERRRALLRPFLGILAFALAAWAEAWWITPFIVFLIFVAVVTVTHDVVHGSLGLSERGSEWALFIMGAVLLESGHAYRISHHRHHSVFPGPDDPEGDPARMSFSKAVLHGPFFLPRLWLILEGGWTLFVPGLGLALLPWTGSVLLYAGLAIVGSWVYPLLTVHLPHRNYGDTPLTQTHTLRGRLLPALFLELTYHLEHHLYPQVPSHHLPELSRRLEPTLMAAGIEPRTVI